MPGYCIGLYKYMRIDEKPQKKEQLLKIQKEVFGKKSTAMHRKFFTYGEFDRISFEYIEKFSRFRDVPKDARGWIGDRQTHLVYTICKDKEKIEDELYYKDGRFYEYKGNEAVQTDRLFLGLTILQFKYSQKDKYNDMETLLYHCKSKILDLVKSEKAADVKCAVFGTLGSYGLTIIWLADQYTDILKLVTKIRNMGTEDNQKSIFLSAYTIFAQNYHEEKSDWKQRMQNVKGIAALHLTLKKGMDAYIKGKLHSWNPVGDQLFHCTGEHDVLVKIRSADVFQIFQNDLHFNSEFFKEYVLQTNVQLCEVMNEELKTLDVQRETDDQADGYEITTLSKIPNAYVNLRKEFAVLFPSTAGMVDTLDMLYSDYISKISTASNEMWIDNFSHQFLRILTCITEFISHLKDIALKKKDILDIVNDLLSDFERQISHIAESNNLVLGTPICQFRYSGQNNLTLYAYFSIIKKVLQFVYETQEVNVQDEIIPLIVTDIVPIIQSKLFFNYNDNIHKRPKIVTINLPMTALYNPVCYYPYLYHEIFHYIVPRDRRVRNQLLGAIISIRILHSVFRDILFQIQPCNTPKRILNTFIDVYLLRYIYSYVVKNYHDYVEKDIDKNIENLEDAELNYENVSKLTPSSRNYEIQVFKKWLDWINEEENICIKDNFLYAFISYLFHQSANIWNDLLLWKESCEDAQTAKEIDLLENQINEFIDHLSGIVDNADLESASKNFTNFTAPLTDNVLNEAHTLCDAIKEGMADTAMIALGNIDFPEYLLLFTKTKKDLLIGHQNIEVQDIIRIGMVLEFLCEDRRSDDDYMDVVDGAKETYINMYCGLYYSSHKLADPSYKDSLILDAENWFSQIRECCNRYIIRYRIYAALLRRLHKGMLVSEDSQTHLQLFQKENCKYWKQYAQALFDCGNYIRNNNINQCENQWNEKSSLINERIFDSNLQFIHKYQVQTNFNELDHIRENRSEECKIKMYLKNSFQLHLTALTTQTFGERPVKGFDKIQWEHKIEKIADLSTLTADIACLLEKLNLRILGKSEYPIWYRGHMSSNYKLIPSIMRKYKAIKAKCKEDSKISLAAFLRQEYEEFKFRADGTSEAVERIGYTDSDYIALMQHYSAASNFLDWTEDALSALYFALEGFFDKKVSNTQENAVLYVFSPALYNFARQKMILRWETNDCRKLEIEKDVVNIAGQNGIPNLTVSYNTDRYSMYQLGKEKNIYDNSKPITLKDLEDNKWIYYLPLAVYVSRLNKRIQAQSGIFLAYNVYTAPDENDSFDYISLEEIQKKYLEDYKSDQEICPFLYKIEIAETSREAIANWVKAFGMSKEKCYPELASIGERIMQ